VTPTPTASEATAPADSAGIDVSAMYREFRGLAEEE
jgi:hypothetical protein